MNLGVQFLFPLTRFGYLYQGICDTRRILIAINIHDKKIYSTSIKMHINQDISLVRLQALIINRSILENKSYYETKV
jgi:hypothetical protein